MEVRQLSQFFLSALDGGKELQLFIQQILNTHCGHWRYTSDQDPPARYPQGVFPPSLP